MNFLRKRSQIPPPPGADHVRVTVLGQRFFRQNSKWRTKLTPVSQVKNVILGKHKLVSIKDKFYILLATLQLNCMKIRLEVLTIATTILLAHTGQFLQDI